MILFFLAEIFYPNTREAFEKIHNVSAYLNFINYKKLPEASNFESNHLI